MIIYFEGVKRHSLHLQNMFWITHTSIEFTLCEKNFIRIAALYLNICCHQCKILFLQISVKLALLVCHQKNSICNSKIIYWRQQIFKYNAVILLFSQKEIYVLTWTSEFWIVLLWILFGFFSVIFLVKPIFRRFIQWTTERQTLIHVFLFMYIYISFISCIYSFVLIIIKLLCNEVSGQFHVCITHSLSLHITDNTVCIFLCKKR